MLSENSQTLLSVTLQMGGVHVTSLPPCWMIFTKDSPCLQFKDHPAWGKSLCSSNPYRDHNYALYFLLWDTNLNSFLRYNCFDAIQSLARMDDLEVTATALHLLTTLFNVLFSVYLPVVRGSIEISEE